MQSSWAGVGAYWFRDNQIYLYGGFAELGERQEVIKASTSNADDGEIFKFLDFVLSDSCNTRQPEKLPVLPERIVVFRDGTGRGQFAEVQEQEFVQVSQAVAKNSRTTIPITFVVCTKRIKQSMVSMSQELASRVKSSSKDETVNIQPVSPSNIFNGPYGAIVNDARICREPASEFYLFSLSSSPSTVRAVHYHIVQNQCGFSWSQVATYAFSLGHLYYNWPGPVLIPSPTQYGHAAAFLASEVYSARKTTEQVLGFHRGLICL